MNYHVRISIKDKSYGEVKTDLNEEELQARFLTPYEEGNPIIINGKTIRLKDLERIQISKSENSISGLIQKVKREDAQSSVAVIGGYSYEWRAAGKAEDITDEYIKGPPGYKAQDEEREESSLNSSSKKVFVVHGHDHELKNDTDVFLRNLNLEPIILHRQPDEGLTIIEKFEQNSDVSFAIILLTPDDIGFKVDKLEIPEDEREVEYRARQNVIFEFGYFVGKLGRSNVCCIYKENVSLPSDISGLIYKKVNNSIEEVGYNLIQEFKNAGLDPQI